MRIIDTDSQWQGNHADLNDIHNENYLKHYVRLHPDNQMVWYLLGKAYMRRGKLKKAQHCFKQAGDVFHAYESAVAAELAQSIPAIEQRLISKKKRSMLRTLICIVSFLLLFMLSASAPSNEELRPMDQDKQWVKGTVFNEQGSEYRREEPKEARIYLFPSTAGITQMNPIIMNRFFNGNHRTSTDLYAKAGASSLPIWSDWTKEPQPVISTVNHSDGGTIVYRYSSEDCRCEPTDGSTVRQMLQNWQMEQEQTLIIASSIRAYYHNNGSWPESIAELNGHYPNNYISGYTPWMSERFEYVQSQIRQDAASSDSSKNKQIATEPLFSPDELPQSLEIVVDVDGYRLAVVSGRMILRSYPIGLGGDKTPEGRFVISEKVMNPNGRADGEFGSRGMTLSDTLYAIHGTDKPESIEKDESLGCIRMLDEDLKELYALVPLGTAVTIGGTKPPQEIIRASKRFSLPHTAVETNPSKVYRWLD